MTRRRERASWAAIVRRVGAVGLAVVAGATSLAAASLPRAVSQAAAPAAPTTPATPATSPASAAGTACGVGLVGARRVASGAAELAWIARPAPLAVGRMVELEVTLCGAVQGAALRVDADMPAHRHGMNYRPSVERIGPGRWRARGLMFHMPGAWRLIFDLDEGGQRLRLTDAVELP